MAEDFNNKIQRLELENFTCFAKAEMDFSSGINVFIGENGTGKTHVLKVLYALSHQDDIFKLLLEDKVILKEEASYNIQNNLTSFFKNKLEILSKNSLNYEVKAFYNGNAYSGLKMEKKESHSYSIEVISNSDFHFQKNLLFIPSMEMLSIYKGFISSYEKRENSFDGTFYNLSKALNALPLKKQDNSDWLKLLEDSFNL